MGRRFAIGLAILGVGLGVPGCGRPPSMGTDKGVFKAVDALYTAVSLRDQRLVENCDAELKLLQKAGKLPTDAAKALDAIIAQAKKAEWEPAESTLVKFMEGQQR